LAVRAVEQRGDARVDEVGAEGPGEVNVLVVKRDRKGAKEGREGGRDVVVQQRLDGDLPQPEPPEQRAKLPNAVAEVRLLLELRRLLREREGVLEGEAGRLGDELGEKASEPGNHAGRGYQRRAPLPCGAG